MKAAKGASSCVELNPRMHDRQNCYVADPQAKAEIHNEWRGYAQALRKRLPHIWKGVSLKTER